MAEEFAFEEGFGDCAAVDDEKGFAVARALPVDGFGDEVFSRAAFSCNEYADGGGRDLCHAFPDLLYGVRASEDGGVGPGAFLRQGASQFCGDERIGEQGIGFECGRCLELGTVLGGDCEDGDFFRLLR